MLFLQNRLKVCPRGLLYSRLGLDIDLKLSIYNWRPEGLIDFKVLNTGDTSEWSVHWIQPCRSTEKGLWKTTHCLYWRSDYIVKYCTYWQADPWSLYSLSCPQCTLYPSYHSVKDFITWLFIVTLHTFNILIRFQPGQRPWGPCHSFLCRVLAGECSIIHSFTPRFTILLRHIGSLIFLEAVNTLFIFYRLPGRTLPTLTRWYIPMTGLIPQIIKVRLWTWPVQLYLNLLYLKSL